MDRKLEGCPDHANFIAEMREEFAKIERGFIARAEFSLGSMRGERQPNERNMTMRDAKAIAHHAVIRADRWLTENWRD